MIFLPFIGMSAVGELCPSLQIALESPDARSIIGVVVAVGPDLDGSGCVSLPAARREVANEIAGTVEWHQRGPPSSRRFWVR
jgi:hypothetical protein